MLFDLLRGYLRVLHHVVAEAGGFHAGPGSDAPQTLAQRHRAPDVGLTPVPPRPAVERNPDVARRRPPAQGSCRACIPKLECAAGE